MKEIINIDELIKDLNLDTIKEKTYVGDIYNDDYYSDYDDYVDDCCFGGWSK